MGGLRRAAIAIAVLSVLCCAGCIKVNMDVAVAPDLSTSGKLTGAFDTSLAELTEGNQTKDPFAEVREASGGRWKTREYREGNWVVHEATGTAAPGEPLFPMKDGQEEPGVKVGRTTHRLSTLYTITWFIPPPLFEGKTKVDEQIPVDQMAEAMQGFASTMLSSFEFHISLAAPGEVVSTTGKAAGPGKAEWSLSIVDVQSEKPPDFTLTTELPNWDTIGKLANQIVLRGGPFDAGCRIADALKRGLLPNPPVSASTAEKLSAGDYQRLLEIIARLDAGAGATVTDVIIKQARLNDETATSARIAAAHEKVMRMDVGLIVEQAAIRGLSGALK